MSHYTTANRTSARDWDDANMSEKTEVDVQESMGDLLNEVCFVSEAHT